MRPNRMVMCAVVLAVAVMAPGKAFAQTGTAGSLSDLLTNLVLNEIILPPAGVPGRPHEAHFSPRDPRFGTGETDDGLRTAAELIVGNFNRQLATQLATFPLGSSSGGFTYSFDESLGTFSRVSRSFGPSFAERALTIGRQRLSVGMNFQRSTYDSFEGENLDDGSIRFYIPHNDCCLAGGDGRLSSDQPGAIGTAFETDIVEAALEIKATNTTVAFFANYGVTDYWDVGVAIPIVSVDLEATVRATIIRLATADAPLVHTFTEGENDPTATFTDAGSATGIGDVILRTKYNFFRTDRGAIAGALDLRLPTGDEADLLGTGATQAKFFLVASSGTDQFGQHFNIGYTFSEEPAAGTGEFGSVSDEFNYAGGVELVPSDKVTIAADIIGRTLRNVGRLENVSRTFEFRRQPVPGQVVASPLETSQPFTQLEAQDGNLNLVLAAIGVKFNPVGRLLVSANVLFPLTDAGLKDSVTPVFGFDYAF